MRVMIGIISALLVGFISVAGMYAQSEPVPAKHARVELLSSRQQGSKDVLLGVHFKLENGWHVYWINPGDSGQPPSFTWELPPGFTVGQIEWPQPERLQNSPTIADYGYRDDVLLLVPLHTPASWKSNSPIDISAKAKWLICREVCIPDHADLRTSLSPASAPASSTARLFAAAKKLLPKPWPKEWKAAVESRKSDFLLTIDVGNQIAAAEFFPLEAGQIENAARQRLEPTARGVKVVLQKSDLLLKPISRLRGVLVIRGHGAYQLEAPVLTQVALK
jgi:DsbC/DsbD-like thiol-disulfide interchange protein